MQKLENRIGKKGIAGVAAQLTNPRTLGLIFIIGVLVYFAYGQTGSLIFGSISGEKSDVSFNGTFKGATFTGITPFIGELSATRTATDGQLNVCGSGDNKYPNVINNNFDVGDNLVFSMYSSSNYNGNPCMDNYLRGEIYFPAGEIKVYCQTEGLQGKWSDLTTSMCQFNGKIISQVSALGKSQSRTAVTNTNGEYSLILTEPAKLSYQLKGDAPIGSVSSAKMTISFTPSQVVETITNEPETTQGTVQAATTNANNFIQRFFDWIRGLFA